MFILERILAPSSQPDWLAEEKGNIYSSIWSCCAKVQQAALVWHHILAPRLIDICKVNKIVFFIFFKFGLKIPTAMMIVIVM